MSCAKSRLQTHRSSQEFLFFVSWSSYNQHLPLGPTPDTQLLAYYRDFQSAISMMWVRRCHPQELFICKKETALLSCIQLNA